MEQAGFEQTRLGDQIPEREFGPLTIQDTVRWAGFQENSAQLHYDREHARSHSGLKTFIASGEYRQALLMRVLTDWIGPRGMIRKLNLRQTFPTYEGDLMRFSAKVIEKSANASDPWIVCELIGKNQEDRQILTGRCALMLSKRSQITS